MKRAFVVVAVAALGMPALARASDAPCAELEKAVDLQSSPAGDRRLFCKFAKDTVASGCCQSSLYDCLKSKPTCARGQVLATLGLGLISTGAEEEKAAAAASAYEEAFPPEKRNVLDASKVPCRGPKDGVVLAEFSDFDCPHCAAAAPYLHKLVETHPRVQLCAFNFPLMGHKFSAYAAAAANYAATQGKFWELSDALFATQGAREVADEAGYKKQILKVATSVGLDPKAVFEAMGAKSPYLEKVRDQQMLGIGLLLQGTPSFFLEGRALNGIPLSQFDAVIRDELESQPKK